MSPGASASTVYWTITGASNAVSAGERAEPVAEQPVPDLPGDGKAAVDQIELALLAALKAGTEAGDVARADRYSTRPEPERPAFRYGATIECANGWRLFLTCVVPPVEARSSPTTGTTSPRRRCRPGRSPPRRGPTMMGQVA
ncbi:hypothetical protein [Kitasatospora phosalacinea]|nr:hypothetical protein [Kitasatospora phosalacinea]